MRMRSKKMMAVILAIATVFSTTIPAMADTTSEKLLASSSASAFESGLPQAARSITIPLTFDGSNPDSSQVVVEKAQEASTKNVRLLRTQYNAGTTIIDDGLPKRVETTVSTTESAITLITADKYFLYTPEDGIQRCPFAGQFEGEATAQFAGNNCYVTLNSSENITQSGIQCRIYQSNKNIYYFNVDDIKSIITEVTNPATIYMSVWLNDYSGDDTKLFGPIAVPVNYVENNVANVPNYCKYISQDSDNFSMQIYLPGKDTVLANGAPDLELSLLDSAGKVVAKTVEVLGSKVNSGYSDRTSDERYAAVFDYAYMTTNYSYISTSLYRAAELLPGKYGVKLSINGTETTYPNMVQVVDGPIVTQVYNSSNGYPPAVIGGSEAYTFVTVNGGRKDDFNISIVDDNDVQIGGSIDSKYLTNNDNTIVYKVALDNGAKFETNKPYFIRLTYNGTGSMYYTSYKDNNIYITQRFDIYDYSFYGDSTVADFNFKAVNVPEDSTTQIELGIFSNENVLIGTAKVNPATTMSHVQFMDINGRLVSVAPNTNYSIKIKNTYSDVFYWDYMVNVYTQSTNPSSNSRGPIGIWSNPYFYIGDTSYDFDIYLPKDVNGITDTTQYVVNLKNVMGETVANVDGDLIEADIPLDYSSEEDVPGVELSGKLAFSVSSLTEDTYFLEVEISGFGTVKTNISGISSDKVYATSSYPRVVTSESGYNIDGYAFMLKKDQSYDVSLFTYEMTDLLGKPIAIGPVTTTHGDYDMTYQDYYSITASITDSIPCAYYFLKLKYDGKDIYDLYKPSNLVFSGYNAVEGISASTSFSWYVGENDACEGIYLSGKVAETDEITAVIYDPNEKVNFTPINILSLLRDNATEGRYVFPESSISDLDGNKVYDIIFLQNGRYIGSLVKKIVGAYVQTVNVSGISLNQSSLDINVLGTAALTAMVAPTDASNKRVTWSSNNAAVAKVDSSSGLVTGVSAGTAIITATTEDGGLTANCTVTVKANIASIALTKLTYDDSTDVAATSGIYNVEGVKYPFSGLKPLHMTIKGTNFEATKIYNYTISINGTSFTKADSALGSELSSGTVIDFARPEYLADGNYVYTIAVMDGASQVAAASFTLSISGTPIYVTGVSLNRQSTSLTAGGTTTLTASITPNNATNKKVTWSSDKATVATVDASTGLVTAVGAGSATITATTEDGVKTAKCTINVSLNVTGTLKYGDKLAQNTWIAMYNLNGAFKASTYTDNNGKFFFEKVTVGEYRLKAYSPDSTYKDLNSTFAIIEGESQKELNNVSFESKYANRATLTVNVKDATQNTPFGKNYTVYVYNYETGISKSISSTDNLGVVTFDDLPYAVEGSNYSVSLYTSEDTDYYCDSEIVNVTGATASVEFNVPVTYKISGTVKATDDTVISYTSVKATKDSDNSTYWGYTDDKGVYVIRGLNDGTYSVVVNSEKYRTVTPAAIEINGANVSSGTDITVQKGMTLIGKVLKNGVPAYKAYVMITDNSDNYIASGYATGVDGFVLDGVIKAAGTYKLNVSSVYNQNGTWQNFVSSPVTIDVTKANIEAGRLAIDATYQDPTNTAQIFTGNGNLVLTNVGIVRSGSSVDLIIKYKNNGNAAVDANFTVDLPAGVTCTNGSSTFSVSGLAPGTSGNKSLALAIGDTLTNSDKITIPVKVTIGQTPYDFGSASIDIANITLTGPKAVKGTEGFKVYGEATANSKITIKNAVTGEVLGTAVPNGRWYSAEIKALSDGTYSIIAEASSSGVTALSQILTVESKADQITVDTVTSSSSGSSALPINKLIGVRAFTAWVGPNLEGRDISIGTKFGNDSTITNVTYRFADKDYIATKDSNGIWNANLTGWSGAGLKTITATVITSDNRVLEFIIAEVTVLVDPSGFVTDAETKEKLEGVTVICEVLNNNNWEKWNAELYGQVNPQITDIDGNYGWMVPAGTYRVLALKAGYDAYSTSDDTLFSADGKSTIVIPPVRTDVNFELTPSILVTDITLNTTSAAITVGNTQTLVAVVTPDNATNAGNIKWTTSDANVATVSNTGVVTAISAGTAVTTATAGSKSINCTVTVSSASTPPTLVTDITLTTTSAAITVGNTLELVAVVTPNNATNAGNIEWTTSNANVATVSNNGIVTAISAGTAVITATVGEESITCTVTVSSASTPILVTGITLDKTSVAITVGNTQTLTAAVTPNNATDAGNIKWTTSNANVATVSNNGVVTAISVGTAVITATVGNKSITCTVTVSTASVPTETPVVVTGGAAPIVVTAEPNPVIKADSYGKAMVKSNQLEKAESLTIKAEATLIFDKAAVEAIKGVTGDVVITVAKADVKIPEEMKTIIGDRPVYDFTLTAGGKIISDFKGGSVKIELPYIAKTNEDANAIVIYYFDAQGKLSIVNGSIYDPATKIVTFKTSHFSKYAVGYNKVEFADVSGWATNAITYLSSRGIISGVGDSNYAPANNITRADFAVILSKIAGADLTEYTSSRFDDVKVSDRYAKAIEWAADNGIVSGVGNGKYAPKAVITRQDMAVMITKLAKVMKHTLPTTIAQTDFADQKAITTYALDAAKAVQKAGIISGKVKGENKEYFFAPKDNATRAEAAQMLYVLIKGMVK